MNAKIHLSSNGQFIGTVTDFDSDRYENACDNPEGHVRSESILDDSDLADLRLDGNETVYALAVCRYQARGSREPPSRNRRRQPEEPMSNASIEIIRYVFGYAYGENSELGVSIKGRSMPISGKRITSAAKELESLGVIRIVTVTVENKGEFGYPIGTLLAVRAVA